MRYLPGVEHPCSIEVEKGASVCHMDKKTTNKLRQVGIRAPNPDHLGQGIWGLFVVTLLFLVMLIFMPTFSRAALVFAVVCGGLLFIWSGFLYFRVRKWRKEMNATGSEEARILDITIAVQLFSIPLFLTWSITFAWTGRNVLHSLGAKAYVDWVIVGLYLLTLFAAFLSRRWYLNHLRADAAGKGRWAGLRQSAPILVGTIAAYLYAMDLLLRDIMSKDIRNAIGVGIALFGSLFFAFLAVQGACLWNLLRHVRDD
jgi:hypothetical protein